MTSRAAEQLLTGHSGCHSIEEDFMKNFLLILLVFVVALGAVGLYRGWFSTEMNTSDQKPNIKLSVDQGKITDDINSLKKAAETKVPAGTVEPPKN
jgi:hypothetical protein